MAMLYEKWAPKTFADFVGNREAVARVQKIIGKPEFDGGFFLIYGPSGCGKTTMANILAAMFSKEASNIENLTGDRCTIDNVQAMISGLRYFGFGGGFRCVIINEAHEVTPKAFEALKTLLDNRPRKTLICLTTDQPQKLGGIGTPIFSRLLKVKLETGPLELAEYAAYLKAVADQEGLCNDRTLDDFQALVLARNYNLRDCLCVIEGDDPADWVDALAARETDPELQAAADLNRGTP